MKIATGKIASFLAKPPNEICAALMHGSDAGLRSSYSHQLAAFYSDDLEDVFSITRISGASLTDEPGKIADAAAEIPMFGKRVVLVTATGTQLLEPCKLLLARPVKNAMVIINASDTTVNHAVVKLFISSDCAAAIGCYPDTERNIQQLAIDIFATYKVSVDRDTLAVICARLGNDHAATRAELEKLVLLAGLDGKLTPEDVSKALGDSSTLIIEDIVTAVASGHVSALAQALRKAWLEDANCVMIIRSCQNYFNHMRIVGQAITTGQSVQEAVRDLRPPVHFKLQNTLIRHAKLWQMKPCTDMLNRMQDIEINLKSKSIDGQTLISQSLLGLCLRAQKQLAS